MDKIHCDTCGKNMTTPDGSTNFIGVKIEVIIKDMDEPSAAWYKEQMYPYDVNRDYCICFPCWLKSLGVKPS